MMDFEDLTLLDILTIEEAEIRNKLLAEYLKFIEGFEDDLIGKEVLGLTKDQNIKVALDEIRTINSFDEIGAFSILKSYLSINSLNKERYEYEIYHVSHDIRPGHVIKMYKNDRRPETKIDQTCVICLTTIKSGRKAIEYWPLFYDMSRTEVTLKNGFISRSFRICEQCEESLPMTIGDFERFRRNLANGNEAPHGEENDPNMSYQDSEILIGGIPDITWTIKTKEEYSAKKNLRDKKRQIKKQIEKQMEKTDFLSLKQELEKIRKENEKISKLELTLKRKYGEDVKI